MDKGPMLWESGSWSQRVGYAGELPQRGTPMAVAEAIRFADLDAWREYQAGVFARTDSAIANTPLERFNDVAIADRPASVAGSFPVRVHTVRSDPADGRGRGVRVPDAARISGRSSTRGLSSDWAGSASAGDEPDLAERLTRLGENFTPSLPSATLSGV